MDSSFINTYCTCDTSDRRSEHIIKCHVTDILTNILQPVFKRHTSVHPTLTRRPTPKHGTDPEIHEDQEWKNENHVETLLWIVQEISPKDLQQNLHLLIPPILIVLDDYDVLYKEQGIVMVHTMIQKLDPMYISKYGLDNVFFESTFRCLTYLSQDRDEPLLKVAYPCILDLIATTKRDKARCDLYERVLKDGIITSFIYAGQKITFLPILLKPISALYEELGAIGVQYLRAIVPTVCDSLAMIPVNNSPKIREINQLAANTLVAVIQKCWPRVPAYKGIIMQALAKSWTHYYKAKDEPMCSLLKQIYQVFQAACQGEEKVDKEALLCFDRNIFEPLFI